MGVRRAACAGVWELGEEKSVATWGGRGSGASGRVLGEGSPVVASAALPRPGPRFPFASTSCIRSPFFSARCVKLKAHVFRSWIFVLFSSLSTSMKRGIT